MPTPEETEAAEMFGISPDELGMLDEDISDIALDEGEIQELMNSAESLANDEKDNPFSNRSINDLVKTYLNATPHGVRWLAEKTGVKRKALQRFLDGHTPLSEEATQRVIGVIVDHNARETQRAQKKQRADLAKTGFEFG